MSLDKYLARTYDPQTYNCLHFATDVWADLKGEDIRAKLDVLNRSILTRADVLVFRELRDPETPCLAMFQAKRTVPHFGVWIRGKVLHCQSRLNVQYVPLYVASIGFTRTRFILPC